MKEINDAVRGWVAYFRYGHPTLHFHRMRKWLENRVRKWLRRRKVMHGYGYKETPEEFLYGKLGLYRIPQRVASPCKP